MDVLLPALLKQKFKGLIRKIFTNPSSLRLGASCGLFAFVYKLSFHIIALALEHVSSSSQDQRTAGSRRSDSGIGLGGRQRRGQHGDGKIVFGGLTQLDSGDENQQQSGSEDDEGTLPVNPKEQAARNRKKWIPALLASLVAAPAYSLIPEKARRLTMALYFLTYAGESAYAALEHEGLLKWLPNWVGIWILAPISTSQIVHTFIQHNDCSPVSVFFFFIACSFFLFLSLCNTPSYPSPFSVFFCPLLSDRVEISFCSHQKTNETNMPFSSSPPFPRFLHFSRFFVSLQKRASQSICITSFAFCVPFFSDPPIN